MLFFLILLLLGHYGGIRGPFPYVDIMAHSKVMKT